MRALLAAAVTAAGGDMTRKWTTAEGLPENTVTALAQSTDGYLWITTPSGVARFDGIRFETYQSPDIPAMPPPVPDRMLVDADGVTWRGTDGGLLRIRPRLVLPAVSEIRGGLGKTTPLPPGATARLLDSAGRVWTGTETNGLSVRLADGAVRRFAAEEGFPARHVSAIAEDNEGDIWVGTDGMGLWRISGTRVSYYRRRGPRGGEFVRALFCDSEGALWIGTRGNGITRMKEGQFTVLPSVGGLPGTTVSAFREDPRGRLWLASGDALVTFALEDFEAYAAGRATEVPVDAFRAEDGYEPCDAACPALDTAALAAVTSASPPRVVWETPVGTGPFAPGTKEIAFSFTADRPGVADRIVFAARLLPTTEGWRSLGGARTVSFHNLPHGKYRLEVRARGPFGGWGEPSAREFAVAPRFRETGLFVALVAVCSLLLAFVAVRYVVLRRMRTRLAVVRQRNLLAAERARIARDIHDDVGARLTRISILAGVASGGGQTSMREVADEVRGVARALDEVVWAVEPRNDTLFGLSDYIFRHAERLVGAAGLHLRADIPVELPEVLVTSAVRHAVFLCTKEALNNVVKHAHARTAFLALSVRDGEVRLTVGDDGVGYGGPRAGGNGMRNMQERMENIGGSFSVGPRAGGGCEVTFTFKAETRKGRQA